MSDNLEISIALDPSVTTKTNFSENVCHVMPCHISPSGPSTTASKYFHVTKIQPDQPADISNGSSEESRPETAKRDATITSTTTDADIITTIESSATEDQKSTEEASNDSVLAQKTATLEIAQIEKAEQYETYFRGRRLVGIPVDLPAELTGVILQETAAQSVLTTASNNGQYNDSFGYAEEDYNDDDYDMGLQRVGASNSNISKKIKTWQQIEPALTFNKLMVWDHERPPNAETNQYITGVTDWVKLAHLVSFRQESMMGSTNESLDSRSYMMESFENEISSKLLVPFYKIYSSRLHFR